MATCMLCAISGVNCPLWASSYQMKGKPELVNLGRSCLSKTPTELPEAAMQPPAHHVLPACPRCIRRPGGPRPTAVPLPPPQAAVPGPSKPSQARRGEILWLLLLCLRGPAWLTASLPWVLPGRGLVWRPLTPEGISGGSTVYFQLIFCFPMIFETEFLKF